MVLPILITEVVVCTALMAFTRTPVSSPNCCAIRGTSFAANMTPKPNSISSCMVNIPKNKSVVCIKVVKQSAITCLHHADFARYRHVTFYISRTITRISVRRISHRAMALRGFGLWYSMLRHVLPSLVSATIRRQRRCWMISIASFRQSV